MLVEAKDGPIDEELFTSVVRGIVTKVRALPIVDSVASYQDGADSLRSSDVRMALVQVTTTLGQDDDLEAADGVLDVVEETNRESGLRVTTIADIVTFTLAVTLVSVSVAFIAAPAYMWTGDPLTWGSWTFDHTGTGIDADGT